MSAPTSPSFPLSPRDSSDSSFFHRLRRPSPTPQQGNHAHTRSSSVTPLRLHIRTNSSASGYSLTTPSPRSRSASVRRTSGTYTQVGRHSNDWLFGGFSFTEAIRGLLSPSSH